MGNVGGLGRRGLSGGALGVALAGLAVCANAAATVLGRPIHPGKASRLMPHCLSFEPSPVA